MKPSTVALGLLSGCTLLPLACQAQLVLEDGDLPLYGPDGHWWRDMMVADPPTSASSAAVGGGGGYYTLGIAMSDDYRTADLVVSKHRAADKMEVWQKRIVSPEGSFVTSMGLAAAPADSGVYVLVQTDQGHDFHGTKCTNPSGVCLYAMRMDSQNGSTVWVRCLPFSMYLGGGMMGVSNVAAWDSLRGHLLLHLDGIHQSESSYVGTVLALNPVDGAILSRRSYGPKDQTYPKTLAVDGAHLYLVGSSMVGFQGQTWKCSSSQYGCAKCYVIQMSTNSSTTHWTRFFAPNEYDVEECEAVSVAVDPVTGDIALAGYFRTASILGSIGFVNVLDAAGGLRGSTLLAPTADDKDAILSSVYFQSPHLIASGSIGTQTLVTSLGDGSNEQQWSAPKDRSVDMENYNVFVQLTSRLAVTDVQFRPRYYVPYADTQVCRVPGVAKLLFGYMTAKNGAQHLDEDRATVAYLLDPVFPEVSESSKTPAKTTSITKTSTTLLPLTPIAFPATTATTTMALKQETSVQPTGDSTDHNSTHVSTTSSPLWIYVLLACCACIVLGVAGTIALKRRQHSRVRQLYRQPSQLDAASQSSLIALEDGVAQSDHAKPPPPQEQSIDSNLFGPFVQGSGINKS